VPAPSAGSVSPGDLPSPHDRPASSVHEELQRDAGPPLLLYSPAGTYPHPVAMLVDVDGEEHHRWTNDHLQPNPATQPASFARGWNHVELGSDGELYTIVPLRGVLRLNRRSELLWACDVAAHHDIVVLSDGILTLDERARLLDHDTAPTLILDHSVVQVDGGGSIIRRTSLFDVLTADLATASLVEREMRRRQDAFRAVGEGADRDVLHRMTEEMRRGEDRDDAPDDRRRRLERLRQLPTSPCDVLHVNALSQVPAPMHGLWRAGDLLLSIRSLDLIVVLDHESWEVRWAWGPQVLSAQHQPSIGPDGSILVFDNGVGLMRSRLVEVAPETGEIVWEYVARPPESFYCEVAGGCERLRDGSILVTDAQEGRVFAVDRDGQFAWSLVIPSATPVPGGRASLYRVAAVAAGAWFTDGRPT
jgi:hypothetical protein